MQHPWNNLSEQEQQELSNVDFSLALYAAICRSIQSILSDIYRSDEEAFFIPSDITIPGDYPQNTASHMDNAGVSPTSSMHAGATSYVPDSSDLLSRWTAAISDPSFAFTPENNEPSPTRSSALVCVVILKHYNGLTVLAGKPH
jgi:hypothetical protein